MPSASVSSDSVGFNGKVSALSITPSLSASVSALSPTPSPSKSTQSAASIGNRSISFATPSPSTSLTS